MERYVCVHGHFYQPPRENPSLEAVELQDSAYPYHDWNERIAAECYGPNGASRILDGEGRIVDIVNNYARISFNVGPTLLAWMEDAAPDVYQSILAADRESRDRFSGHGSALAQAYNHVILPLANPADKRTQILWGIRDFQHRFGRDPEGMWLPETAVDLESLEIMAELGLRFTILAQHQASRVRKTADHPWRDVSGGQIDPTRAYRLRLSSGRKIDLFFYDGPISRAVAFEGLLDRGENLANRLVGAFSGSRAWPQLVHIATDGESYGHHHRHGDMALSYGLNYIESNTLARLTDYGEYLEKHPPTHEVEIFKNSSWSCIHGIERWKSDCGCNSGGQPHWNQGWRALLREAMDWLRDELAPRFEKRGRRYLKDPWAARDDYISVILDRSPENVEQFLSRHSSRELSEAERSRVLKLMELQRHALLMYTSCGWFFDELSGIETVQVIQYAGRALQLARELFGEGIEPPFLERLERAKSNIAEHRDGRQIYDRWVKPPLVDLPQVGAHYAMSSLFESYEDQTRVHCYTVDREDYSLLSSGKVRLALGRAKIASTITLDSTRVNFGVLHLGDHNLAGGVREFSGEEDYESVGQEVSQIFERSDLTELLRVVDRNFGSNSYSLKLLFKDQQRKILGTILDSTLGNAEAVYRQVYEHNTPMMRFLVDLGTPLPRAWLAAAELVVNTDLRRAFEGEETDPERVSSLLEEARTWGLALDGAGLGYTVRRSLERRMEQLRRDPSDQTLLERLAVAVESARSLPFELELWRVQNLYHAMLLALPDRLQDRTRHSSQEAQDWIGHFVSLGEKLGFRMEEMNERLVRQEPALVALAEEVASQRRVPRATYRLQLNRAFTLRDARALIPYLRDLGVGDCYVSPLLQPRADSPHGYDICDHNRINPALGSEEDFEVFASELRAHDMGLLLDVVPNHMGIGDACNRWWMDVLENGPSSIYANYFDIDWHPVKPELQNRVLLPILEDAYGRVLEGGKFRLAYENGAFFLYHYETKLPVGPRSYSSILSHQLDTLVQALGEEHEHVRELRSILTGLSYLPPETELAPERVEERNREKEVIKDRIAALHQANPYLRAAVDTALQAFNGAVGDPRSFDMMDELLSVQAYRPAFWRVAAEEINYRRFFDINDLAAIRMELPEVFQATHQLILRHLSEGRVTGLRIDHPDGLWNPRSYLRQLQEGYVRERIQKRIGEEATPEEVAAAVSGWFEGEFGQKGASAPLPPLYVVAEKILAKDEALPEDWAVNGTTGYDFLNAVNGLFVDGGNEKPFDRVYSQFVGSATNFRNLTNSSKKMIMLVSLASEINALAHQLERVAEKNRLYRDFTLNSLTFALREVIAALPVYRTYITEPGLVSRQDEVHLEAAVEEAKKRNPRTAASIFDFLRDTLLLRNLQDFLEEDCRQLVDLAMKFQQLTGPVTAKGVEDTAFYVYNRLVSLNEVGGHPERFGVTVAEFHRQNSERARRWPHSLLATSTHDTKRSEDVRARIDVLSEMPEEWRRALARWGQINLPKKGSGDGEPIPDRNDEYLLYQTLLGGWPEEPIGTEEFARFRDRIAAYMQKATKEAKVHTSWINANEQYDAAVQDFVRALLPEDREADPFLRDLLPLQRRVAYYGRFNALSQTLLKLTSPGVPDLYQGTELWDFSLVDPDNRRPVDYRQRQRLLSELRGQVDREDGDLVALARQLLESAHDGRIKLYLIHRTLDFRRAHPDLFSEGSYIPLAARGGKRDHVCAFARVLGDDAALIVVPRLVVRLAGGSERPPCGPQLWKDGHILLPRELRGRGYRNLFTGEAIDPTEHQGTPALPLAELLAHFPVALLVRDSSTETPPV